METPRWKDPGRKRATNIQYNDPNFTKYYDLDLDDFTKLVIKLRNKQQLTEQENNRYGIYVLTMALIVQEGPKFKNKCKQDREEMLEYQTLELLTGLPQFDPNRGSSIYSFGYRIGYTSACHYYTDKISDYKKKQEIDKHCEEEWVEYMKEFSTHKVSNLNKELNNG